jgi:hypothetical protein
MGFERMMALLGPCREFFKDAAQGPALLAACDAEVLAGISSALRTLFTLRAAAFA